MSLLFNVKLKKQLRVILDSDAACEADDPFAIAHALMSPKLSVRAIFATHFNEPGSVERSYDEIQAILSAMSLNIPVYMGANGKLGDNQPLSPASKFLIEEAMSDDSMPLFVLCMGAITNVAAAIKASPEIIPRMQVVWIGGHEYNSSKPIPFKEFNSGNDIKSANIILNSGVSLWQIPSNVYTSMRIGLVELQKRLLTCGDIGRHLFEFMIEYNKTDKADWTAGESWSLGDSPAVGVAIDENCGRYEYREAPVINDDTSYTYRTSKNRIRVYTSIDSRFILEDFFAKLELLYG